jgi:hypothetical protein
LLATRFRRHISGSGGTAFLAALATKRYGRPIFLTGLFHLISIRLFDSVRNGNGTSGRDIHCLLKII